MLRNLTSLYFACFLTIFLSPTTSAAESAKRPNIIIIITDDQGYGDLGCHGNPKIKTPNLDRFAQQSAQLSQFYVCPVCSPTRSSLLTGRYNYRTGVVDTFIGRSLMYPDETTLAEILKSAGYRTGIFGKWHLGDNYPMRPQEQGFEECLVLKGGGIGQPSDLPGGESYFDPVLLHNGKVEKQKGYCTDVFASAAIDFISQKSDKPFFTYLPFNCPHGPLEVKDADWKPYREMNLDLSEFPKTGFPILGKYDKTETAKIYGMVSNIDENLGRLFKVLDDAKLSQDTLVIFMTDNGPQQPRYVAGLRGRKASVYEGGVRVPCYIRWPGKFTAGKKVDTVAAHIDMLPTLLDACEVPLPKDLKIDGRSVLPLLKGEKVDWPDRYIASQWHRGDQPELYRACMIRGPRYKLVQAAGANQEKLPAEPKFELFDILDDPYEQKDLAPSKPEMVQTMRAAYEAWFKDVSKTRGFAPSRIYLGSPKENPSLLTRQDWRGPKASWQADGEGYWEVFIAEPGTYRITLHFQDNKAEGMASARIDGKTLTKPLPMGSEVVLEEIKLDKGEARLEAWVESGKGRRGVRYVEVRRLD